MGTNGLFRENVMNRKLTLHIGAVMALGASILVGTGIGSEVRAAEAKMSFAEDVMPIFQGP